MKVLTIIMTFAIVLTAFSGQTIEHPVEIGDVQWGRNLDSALEDSAETGKPVLVLFTQRSDLDTQRRRIPHGRSAGDS